jgi:RNA polymerase sigma factor for flagellar operon FliA
VAKAATTKKSIKVPVNFPRALEAYLPLVHSIASMVSGKGLPPNIDYNDLVSDGTVGLMKAWDNFDPKRGVKFETYASYRVRGEILDGLRNYNPVPYRVQVMIRDVAQKGYRTLLKKDPKKAKEEAEDLLSKKELTEEEFKAALSRIKKIVSASALMYLLSIEGMNEENEIQVAGEGSPAEDFEFSELRKRLNHAVDGLPEMDKKIVRMFYNEGVSQKDIASKLKLSRSKVNRVLGKAIITLKGRVS